MNKNVIFLTFGSLTAVGIVGHVVLAIIRPESVGTFTNGLTLYLGLVVSAAGTFFVLGNQDKKLESINRQTNGQLHARDETISNLQQVAVAHGAPAEAVLTASVPIQAPEDPQPPLTRREARQAD